MLTVSLNVPTWPAAAIAMLCVLYMFGFWPFKFSTFMLTWTKSKSSYPENGVHPVSVACAARLVGFILWCWLGGWLFQLLCYLTRTFMTPTFNPEPLGYVAGVLILICAIAATSAQRRRHGGL